MNSEALRLEIRVQLFGLAGTAAAGKAFGDVNFVPVLVSAAIFVAGGAVSSASMIRSWQQLHAALHRRHALTVTAAAASHSPVSWPAQGSRRPVVLGKSG